MFVNNKLFIKYILNSVPFSFIDNFSQKNKSTNILITNQTLIYLMTHFRFSTVLYSSQLVDMFAYEVLLNNFNNKADTPLLKNNSKTETTVIVYNIHSMYTQDRFFIFTSSLNSNSNLGTRFTPSATIPSITELFSAANWLERELGELSGVMFSGKKDVRNLMLQYGDSSAPFQKSFPSIGIRETFYEPLRDTVIQNPITLQL